MKEFFEKTFYGNTVLEWLIALGIILGAFIASKILFWFIGKVFKKAASKTKSKLDDILIDMLEEPAVLAVILVGFWVGINRLTMSEKVMEFIIKSLHIAITLNVTWFVTRLIKNLIDQYLVPLVDKSESDLDDQLLPLARKGLNAILWILGIVVALNNAGFDIGALIAGLGIGGLALAMAAKDSVSNIFGGFTIFTDKPFKVNDRIRVGGFDGTVTEIGLRSFRLKTLSGTIVTIPNSQVTDGMVENVTLEPSRKMIVTLGLTYDTTPEKMEEAIQVLKDIVAENDSVEDDAPIGFSGFGDSALEILFIYYIKKGEDIMNTRTQVNMAVLKEYNARGLSFAFPSHSIYMEKK